MSPEPLDPSAVVVTLKKVLRKQNMSYRDLAEALGMSESGIKKLMTGRDITLGRLGDICRCLSIDMVDLLQAAKADQPGPITFTEKQEAFLDAEPACHAFLTALITYDLDTEAVERDFDLDRASVSYYLARLERQGFVTVTSTGRLHLTHGAGHWYRYRVPAIEERIIDSLRFAYAQPRTERSIRNGRVRLSPAHLDELNHDILELLLRYQRLANRDELHLAADQLIDVWVLAATSKQQLRDVLRIPRHRPRARPARDPE